MQDALSSRESDSTTRALAPVPDAGSAWYQAPDCLLQAQEAMERAHSVASLDAARDIAALAAGGSKGSP